MFKILVIENDVEVLASIKDLLETKGYQTFIAENGEKGIKLAKEKSPDLILCDISMPGMDGYEVLQILNNDPLTSGIPFLFLTGRADINDMRKGMELGADDYFVKPFKAHDLLKAISLRIEKKKFAEEKFKLVWDNSHDGMCLMDATGKIIMVNQSFCTILDKTKNELQDNNILTFFKKAKFDSIFETDSRQIFTDEYILWNNKKKWIEISSSALNPTKNVKIVLIIARDISEHKEDELKIRNSLKEKEVLLKEIHHRVKNNLQIISSLLSLQGEFAAKDFDQTIITESQNRIRTMSLIHEKIYQSNDIVNININEYIHELVEYLVITYAIDKAYIKFKLEADSLKFNLNTAIPLGIMINELITNSFKYAFPNKKPGHIVFSIKNTSENEYLMIFEDDGIGLPEDFDLYSMSTLGFTLITNLVEQLNGTIEHLSSKGTKFRITFSTI